MHFSFPHARYMRTHLTCYLMILTIFDKNKLLLDCKLLVYMMLLLN
jgi:hypothetical protein